LIEINPSQVTPRYRALFDRSEPTSIRCMAVLGGGNAGRIFTDDLVQPRLGYVWERDDGHLYLGGMKDAARLQEMVYLLRRDGAVTLSFRDSDPMLDIFPPDPDAGAECLEFDRPIFGSDLSGYLTLPASYEVFRMSRDLIEKSPRLDDTLSRYPSLETYFETGLGVCILHGDVTVCEARADMDVGGVREVGIFTMPAYRGKGWGTIAVAHLLKWCDELGCATYWDCAKYNIASVKITLKLGFRNERSYKLYGWFPAKEDAGKL
jgi:RimJ/RimL family protein N-acetyltransferase